jgi:predicted ATPase
MLHFALGDYTTAQSHLQYMVSHYTPDQHHRTYVSLRGSDGGLAALAYWACCLWCLGYPEQAAAQSRRALTLARQLGHAWSAADALCYAGGMFHEMRRDPHSLIDAAAELSRVAEEGVPGWETSSIRQRGEALALLGKLDEAIALMREGIGASRSISVCLYLPGTLGFLAEAQANAGRPSEGLATLNEAFTIVEETGERHWEAELHRIRAEILLIIGDQAQAEASLHKALDVARRQSAKAWELRVATSLARLWASRDKSHEAHQLLAGVYDWFTEGFDTPDLTEARTLLESLS